MKYTKSNKYDQKFLKNYIMGPNPMKLLEELLAKSPLMPGQTVLDLGCGRGVTSLFLVKEYGVRVFAADLWISPSENKKFFDEMGLTSEQVIPIKAEAHELPFADGFFDAVVSVDSYHYFGLDKAYLGKHLLPLVKPGGWLLVEHGHDQGPAAAALCGEGWDSAATVKDLAGLDRFLVARKRP